MIAEKKMALKPIFESQEGIHLTAYLVNRGDIDDLKMQLRESLNEAYEYLVNVMPTEERTRLLDPLYGLLKDGRIFKGMKGNIGLFRTQESFRVLNVPVPLVRQCHVANTFHVKPLLRWMQIDRDFLLLGLESDSAHLYFGNQHSYQRVETFFLGAPTGQEELFIHLNDRLQALTKRTNLKLFLAGERKLVQSVLSFARFKNVVRRPVADNFDETDVREVIRKVRGLMETTSKKSLEKALLEFRVAEEMNVAEKNIFHIAKAAVQGRVKKLIVADGVQVYGRIDRNTGSLSIHPFDLDHEDDDILDDIAQTVLAAGGEVVVAPREEIPKSRPALAILDMSDPELQMIGKLDEWDFPQKEAL